VSVEAFVIDECLTPDLAAVAKSRGHDAYTVLQRFGQGARDWDLMPRILAANLVLVTNNRTDFLKLYAKEEVHGGCVVIVPNVPWKGQLELFGKALETIEREPDIVNMLVEVRADGSVSMRPWSRDDHDPAVFDVV
jgi:predicted nuclease of predicted toxin-antitoxin system